MSIKCQWNTKLGKFLMCVWQMLMTTKQSSSIRASKLGKLQEKSHLHYVLYSFLKIRQTMLGKTENAPVHLEGWIWFLVSVDMKTIIAGLPVSSSRSVVRCKGKLHARCCHWFYRCFAFASSSFVAVAQSKRKRVFVAKFHTSSLNQYNDVFMLAVKHDWKAFATMKSRVANFKQHFDIKVKI